MQEARLWRGPYLTAEMQSVYSTAPQPTGPFCLVGFYGISTIVGYLKLNPVYTYILNIYMICKHIL